MLCEGDIIIPPCNAADVTIRGYVINTETGELTPQE